MKKILSFVLLAVFLCFLITACSPDVKPSEKTNIENSNIEKVNKEDIVNNKQETIAKQLVSNTHKDEGKNYYVLNGVPVLMYHSIGVEKGNPIRMPKEQFETQMKYLKENGYTAITLNQLYSFLNGENQSIEKPIVITFDDGYLDNYTDAFPILKKYNIKATIFVITDFVDKKPEYLTSQQIKELDAAGILIESHTVTHRELNTLSYDEQLKELKNSKEFLEKTLGRTVDYIAYPIGKYNLDTIKAAEAVGYKMGFSTKAGWSEKSNGMLTLDRVYISTFYSMDVFYDRINNHKYKQY